MPWILVQAGSALFGMGTDGSTSSIGLPSNVTLDLNRKLRAAILNRIAVIVNAPTVNLAIDETGLSRGLVPLPPTVPLTLAAGTGTGLTGTYKVRHSFGVKDRFGRTLAESPLGPEKSVVLANTGLAVSNMRVSLEAYVNTRFLYRTTSGGDTYFKWADIDDNASITTFDNNLGDAGLSLLATLPSDLGVPPGTTGGGRLKLIVRWKNRLWAVSDIPTDIDNIRFCEVDRPWAWPAQNVRGIPPVGAQSSGITALIPRRDDLGICKYGSVTKLVGDSAATFQVIIVSEGSGIVAPDSIAVIDDVGYGLGQDGVYRYDDNGFVNISKEKNHAWFTTDDYFNRSRFAYAEGRWDPKNNSYDLLLSAAGSSALDRWVSFDLKRRVFTGPHKTDGFTPTTMKLITDSAGQLVGVMGGNNGFVYLVNQSTKHDDTATAIDARAQLVLPADTPDIDKVFEQLDIMARIESAGRTLTITPTVGGLDATPQSAMTADLTLGRQRLPYIGGPGRILQLDIRNNTVDHDFLLYALELPYFEWGRK